MKQYDLKAKPTAVGGPAANLTAVMSGQIDVGWAAPPFGLDQLDKKEIRIIATGNDAAAFKGQTVRLNIANANFLKDHKAVVDRYMKAYRETVNFMYTDPKALKVYSEWLNITEAKAKRTRDDFFPRSSIEPDKIIGLDTIVKDAVALKFTANELTKAQLDELIQNSAAVVLGACGLKEVAVRCPISAHPRESGDPAGVQDLDARFRGHERDRGDA